MSSCCECTCAFVTPRPSSAADDFVLFRCGTYVGRLRRACIAHVVRATVRDGCAQPRGASQRSVANLNSNVACAFTKKLRSRTSWERLKRANAGLGAEDLPTTLCFPRLGQTRRPANFAGARSMAVLMGAARSLPHFFREKSAWNGLTVCQTAQYRGKPQQFMRPNNESHALSLRQRQQASQRVFQFFCLPCMDAG